MSSENLNLPGTTRGNLSNAIVLSEYEFQLLEAVKEKQITEMWLDEHLKKTDIILDEDGNDTELNRLLDKLSLLMQELKRLEVMREASEKKERK